MTRYVLGAAVLLVTAGSAWAQQDPVTGMGKRERVRRPALPAPTETELGVPVYPGARFDGDVSGGMTQSDQKVWVYYSDDAPAKVVAFYQQKTGKKANEWDKDKFLIGLKGNPVMPEHGLTIETLAGNPLFAGKGKTVITVSRTTRR